MANYTTIDDPGEYFNTVIYTGNNVAARGITGVGFQPDWVWLKDRSVGYPHITWDSGRTNKASLAINTTAAEVTTTARTLSSFDSDGFTTPNVTGDIFNDNGTAFVAWNWYKDSTAGFDIVSWAGNATNRTISHSLSAVPTMMIVKNRSAATSWIVYHHKNTAAPQTDHLKLDTNDATSDDDSMWNDTAPTSSVLSLKTSTSVNGNSANYIAYLFAEKQGYSKFGSYTGNGNADGSFVYLGFKPAFLIIKCTDAARSWQIHNSKSSPFNTGNTNARLFANLVDAEATNSSLDLLSNGFKVREADDLNTNGSGNAYIYMAFAENPFVTSTGVPATAR